ncbi:MAG: hypothetical protein ACE5D6_06335 [Candidatus Zixiibacteriota bacterium]
MDLSIFNPGSWLGILGSVGLLLASHLAKKYVIPFLQIGKRQQYAQFIATIADEITNDLKRKYPEKVWLKHLDEAVDSLIAICNISPEIARRAINASIYRK